MTVYVKLLDEGTESYRPVPAEKIHESVYKIQGFDLYDAEDETWEFKPGSLVSVVEKTLSGAVVLVAVQELQ